MGETVFYIISLSTPSSSSITSMPILAPSRKPIMKFSIEVIAILNAPARLIEGIQNMFRQHTVALINGAAVYLYRKGRERKSYGFFISFIRNWNPFGILSKPELIPYMYFTDNSEYALILKSSGEELFKSAVMKVLYAGKEAIEETVNETFEVIAKEAGNTLSICAEKAAADCPLGSTPEYYAERLKYHAESIDNEYYQIVLNNPIVDIKATDQFGNPWQETVENSGDAEYNVITGAEEVKPVVFIPPIPREFITPFNESEIIAESPEEKYYETLKQEYEKLGIFTESDFQREAKNWNIQEPKSSLFWDAEMNRKYQEWRDGIEKEIQRLNNEIQGFDEEITEIDEKIGKLHWYNFIKKAQLSNQKSVLQEKKFYAEAHKKLLWENLSGQESSVYGEIYGNNDKLSTFGFAIRHPIIAFQIGEVKARKGNTNISTNAARFANAFEFKENEAQEGSEVNAVRHATWIATVTNKWDKKIALQLGNAHEKNHRALVGILDIYNHKFDTLSEADEAIDLLNNNIGREIGANRAKDATMKEITRDVLDYYYNTGLYVAVKKDGGYYIAQEKLSKERYEAALATLGTLDKYGFPPDSEYHNKKK